MNYNQLIEVQHNRVLKQRCIQRMISTPLFQRLYADSHRIEIDAIIRYINGYNVDQVREWMNTHRKLDPSEMSMIAMKKVAKNRGIKNWSRLTKLELIRAIRHDEETNDRNDPIPDSGDDSSFEQV